MLVLSNEAPSAFNCKQPVGSALLREMDALSNHSDSLRHLACAGIQFGILAVVVVST